MKKTCAQLKDAAREALLGHYSLLIAAMLVSELISLILNIPFSRMIDQGILYTVPSRIILGYVGTFIVSLVTTIISVGLCYMHLQISRRSITRFSDILYGFRNRPDRYIGYGLLITLISFVLVLPGTVCIIAFAVQIPVSANIMSADTFLTGIQLSSSLIMLLGIGIALMIIGFIISIIIMLGLSQSIYLLLDHHELRVTEAMRTSLRYMKGNKWRLFKLYLSFIGWLLLGLLTFGIGYLWIEPYFSQSLIQFYLDLTGTGSSQSEY